MLLSFLYQGIPARLDRFENLVHEEQRAKANDTY